MRKNALVFMIILAITFALVVVSVIIYPSWLTSGGLIVLSGIVFKAVLNSGSEIKNWRELLFDKKRNDFQDNIDNLTGKQKDALIALVHLGETWRDEFTIIWHEINLNDILEYDGNPPQISQGSIHTLEKEGFLNCVFSSNDRARIVLSNKSYVVAERLQNNN